MNKIWPDPHLQGMHKPPPEMLAVELHCRHSFVALRTLHSSQEDNLVVEVRQLLEWDLSFFLHLLVTII